MQHVISGYTASTGLLVTKNGRGDESHACKVDFNFKIKRLPMDISYILVSIYMFAMKSS